ncbi:hypothetical protein ACFYQA_22275 [Streptomyces sp. NPDC005774]|uniref:hypothetical protein n=1 Tax=Streptomyces sp. NPDC005774 TaxID=3364728 RepID=UPI00369BDEF3
MWTPGDRLPAHPLEGCTAATEGDRVWLVWYTRSRSGTYLTRTTPSTGEVISHLSPVHQPDGSAVRGNRAVLVRQAHHRRPVELTRAEFDGTTWTVTDRRDDGGILDRPSFTVRAAAYRGKPVVHIHVEASAAVSCRSRTTPESPCSICMFDLKAADGALGSTQKYVQTCYREFRGLAEGVLARAQELGDSE